MLEKKIGHKCVDFKSPETIGITNSFNNAQTFTFDRVYDDKTNQEILFNETVKPLIYDLFKGYNGTIFTYGQSGSGKTYTMYGAELLDEETQGIIPRTISEIFEFINAEENKEIRFELKFSMLEIYQEQLYDLLNPDSRSHDLKIKEHTKKGIYVENLSEVYISSQEEFLLLIHEAERARIVKETGLNKCSSRSHLLFQLQITQKFPDDTERRGLLNLIDLAGSEKVSKTHAIGETLNEAKKINSSLSTLGKVISILATNTGEYVPYRESKLTRILQDSLGGNSKTILIVNCSIHSYNADETIYTLNFAKRAKKIKNKIKQNIKHSAEQLESIIEMLTLKLRLAHEEISRLKGSKNENEDSNQANFIAKSFENSIIKNLDNLNIKDINKTPRQSGILGFSNLNEFEKDLLEGKEQIKNLNENLKKKDEEISSLNDKIESLQQENKTMQEKLENIYKQNNMDKYIESLDKSLKDNLANLRDLFINNRKDEVETLTIRMKEIKKFYEDFEKNYVHLFRKITDFKDIDFDKKMNMILNDNFHDLVNENTNDKFQSKTNLNVNINNFNNYNNITVNNQIRNSSENKNSPKISNSKDSQEQSIFEYSYKNLTNYDYDNKHLNSIESSISPDKKPTMISFEEPKGLINNFTQPKRMSTFKSGVLTFNNDSSKNSNCSKSQTNPIGPIGNTDKIINYRFSFKKPIPKKEEVNFPPKIPNSNREKNNIKINSIKKEIVSNNIHNEKEILNENSLDNKLNPNNKTRNLNFTIALKNNENIEEITNSIKTNKNIVFESYSNLKTLNSDFKDNILSEAKKVKFEIKTKESANLEFDCNDDNCSINSLPQFGGSIYNFNFYCEEFFKKIDMQLNSRIKSNTSNDLIIMSYKNLFSSNQLFSLKIFDDFLKRKEDYKTDLINNLYQNSLDNLISGANNITYSENLFSRQGTINNLIFSPESKNNERSKLNSGNKEEFYFSPTSNMTVNKFDENDKNYIREFEKSQIFVDNNNLFNNKTFNKNNLDKNATYINNGNYLDSDYFIKMKNCIIKLMLKIIYFENMNYDLLNRLSIDLSKNFLFNFLTSKKNF